MLQTHAISLIQFVCIYNIQTEVFCLLSHFDLYRVNLALKSLNIHFVGRLVDPQEVC